MNIFTRLRYTFITLRYGSEDLNRRATVEQMLFDVASGKRPVPTRQECRQLAMYLGIRGYKRPMIHGETVATPPPENQ